MLHVQKTLATALEAVKVVLKHVISKTKEWGAVTANYEDLSLIMEQRMAFANKKMTRLEKEAVQVKQERRASLAKAEQLSFEV